MLQLTRVWGQAREIEAQATRECSSIGLRHRLQPGRLEFFGDESIYWITNPTTTGKRGQHGRLKCKSRSKESLASMQPELGVPLYVPDYQAPANVYDPASAADFTDAEVSIDPGMIGQYTVEFTFDSEQLRLWTTTLWPGMTDVGSGRYQINPGVALTPNTSSLAFEIEGLTNSIAFAADSILVEAIPNAGGAALEDSGFYTVVETGVGVDGNRDT